MNSMMRPARIPPTNKPHFRRGDGTPAKRWECLIHAEGVGVFVGWGFHMREAQIDAMTEIKVFVHSPKWKELHRHYRSYVLDAWRAAGGMP